MGMPLDVVQAEVKKQVRTNSRITSTRVIAGEQGAQRSVVVERRVVRRFGNDKRTGTCTLSSLFPIQKRTGFAGPLF